MDSNVDVTDLVPATGNGMQRAETPPQPQFMTSFEGAGVQPFPDAVRAVLAAPVDPAIVEIKPDGIPYVPGVEWRRVLTRAFGVGGWAIMPRTPPRIMGNVVTYHGVLVCHGRFVAEAVGESRYIANNQNSTYATALEGAKTDAIGRACKDLCIYSELWNPPWLKMFKDQFCVSWKGNDNKERWARKDAQSRRPPDSLDLMSGAGGRLPDAPSAPASPPAATQRAAGAAAPAEDSTGGAASAVPPPASPTHGEAPPPVDHGEAAAASDYEAVAREMKRLAWKKQYAVIWLKDFFGVETVRALTAQQCASALALLMAVEAGKKPGDCAAYTAMVANLTVRGAIG